MGQSQPFTTSRSSLRWVLPGSGPGGVPTHTPKPLVFSSHDGQAPQLRSPDKTEAHMKNLAFACLSPNFKVPRSLLHGSQISQSSQPRVENKVNAGKVRGWGGEAGSYHPRARYTYSATPTPSQFTHQKQPEAVGCHSKAPEPWCLPTAEARPPRPPAQPWACQYRVG